ncbi:hypothetical protein BSK56_08965 [Paenibacillus borealis]|uniref:Core-binding (CB) domain-containing protein n=1 Tax=Paenibacillus borealis TaxID=160799 RepID=A0ABX3HH15_PAEBO|nr:hypothetical protein [Paenibacillus borealis]OMD49473.1 hypothetical protein BSK56_08965 [Paenibacillus borealis]
MNEHEIMNIVYHFGIKLTKSKFDMYIPKIRDYFAKYILENKSGSTIENVLKYEITRNDIIQSTVYYILKNKNVRSKSAIDDYLTIINRFFEEAVFSHLQI